MVLHAGTVPAYSPHQQALARALSALLKGLTGGRGYYPLGFFRLWYLRWRATVPAGCIALRPDSSPDVVCVSRKIKKFFAMGNL
jgi:hypothetical protein